MYRIFAYLKWDEGIYNHISLRVPGEPGFYLMNPFGPPPPDATAVAWVTLSMWLLVAWAWAVDRGRDAG